MGTTKENVLGTVLEKHQEPLSPKVVPLLIEEKVVYVDSNDVGNVYEVDGTLRIRIGFPTTTPQIVHFKP